MKNVLHVITKRSDEIKTFVININIRYSGETLIIVNGKKFWIISFWLRSVESVGQTVGYDKRTFKQPHMNVKTYFMIEILLSFEWFVARTTVTFLLQTFIICAEDLLAMVHVSYVQVL